jgi:hypothetical protein
MLFPKFITQKFYNTLNKTFPASQEDIAFRRFLMYLSLGSWYDEDYNYLKLSQFVCSTLEKKPMNGDYIAKDYLDKMQSYLPNMIVNGWVHNGYEQEEQHLDSFLIKENVVRLLIDPGFDESFKLAVEQEKVDILATAKTDLVHYATGSKYNRIRHKAQMEKENSEDVKNLTNYVASSLVSLQKEFLDYFNNLDTHSFNKIVDKNLQEAVALTQSFNFKNEQVRDRNIKILDAIKLQPKPYYYAVEKSRRIYGLGSCIPYLKREIRKALTKGWIEFDISNCHLAVIAKDWNIPELTEMLKTSTIWKYLSAYYDVVEGKEILKKAIYGLVYGSSKANIIEKLKEGGMTEKQARQFFTVPMIDNIYQARKRELKTCTTLPVDCFGEKLVVEYDENDSPYSQKASRKILARKAQAVEFKMLEPLMKFSKENSNVMLVCLYQFDGFSAVCKQPSRMETHCHKLKSILDNHIKEMGYETFVEYKIN